MEPKETIKEVLLFGIYKLDHNLCTPEEIDSVANLVKQSLDIYGTVEDISNFYGVSEQRVRDAISRKLLDKPKRRVYYRFKSFLKVVPKKWITRD